MAGRHHRRLVQQLEGGLAPAEEEEEEAEGEEAPASAPFNPFSLLTDSEVRGGWVGCGGLACGPRWVCSRPRALARSYRALQDEGGKREEEEGSGGEQGEGEGGSGGALAAAAAVPAQRAKKRKKKKKAGGAGGGGGKSGGVGDGEGEEGGAARAARESEDLDAILRELNITPAATVVGAAAAEGVGAPSARPLLGVDMRFLRAEEELKRMFGARVVEEDEDDGGGEGVEGGGSRVCVWGGPFCAAPGPFPALRPPLPPPHTHRQAHLRGAAAACAAWPRAACCGGSR